MNIRLFLCSVLFLLTFAAGMTAQQVRHAAGDAAANAADKDAPAAANAKEGDDPNAPKLTRVETIEVTAPGEVRTEQTIGAQQLQEAQPGASPIQAVGKLPSVSVTGADPFGAYEWAVRISIRGFNQNQLGFTLDDVPLGDMSYGNWNGLHISRAAISENIGRIVLSQGAGALEAASTSNLGGTLQFYTLDPSDKRNAQFSQSFGSFNTYRSFMRYDSGLLKSNIKFALSGVVQRGNKWKGAGEIGQNYWQINAKLMKYIGDNTQLTAFLNYSDRQEVDYQDLSKAYVNKLGYNFDNYGDWGKSIQAAYACNGVGAYPGAVNNLTPAEDPCDAAYYGGSGLRKDLLGGFTIKAQATPQTEWKMTLYAHRNDGRGLWFTPYVGTPSTLSPISLRTSEYGQSRGGVLASFDHERGRNAVKGGLWVELESFDLARRFYGTTIAAPTHSLYDFPSNPFYTQWAYNFFSVTTQLYLEDEFKLNNKTTLFAGFKTSETTTDGRVSACPAGNCAAGKLTSGKPFLPQVGVNYKINKENELFADVAYNVRSYVAGAAGFGNSPWGTTPAGFAYLKTTLHPETSWTEEAGYRYTSKLLKAQANFFHVNFNDRLLATQVGSGIQGNPSILSNVGGVTTNGVDLSATVRLAEGLNFYNGFTFNRSTYDDNVSSNGALAIIKGKLSVDTPEKLYKTDLSYDHAGFKAHIGGDYMSVRYYSYTNDANVGGRFLGEGGVSYEKKDLGELQDLKFSFNVYNLFNKRYYSSIGTNGFVMNDASGLMDTLQVGSPRSYAGSITVRF